MGAIMTKPTYSPEYMTDVIADELALAKLLRYGNIVPPIAYTPNAWLYGTKGGETGNGARLAATFLPKWRRTWDGAGELIAICEISITQSPFGVSASDGLMCSAGNTVIFTDHPTKDDAIRAAICKAAIAYLTAKRARQNERAPS